MRPTSIRKLALNALSAAALLSLGAIPMSALTASSSVVLTLTTPTTIYFGQNVDGYAQVNSSDGSALTGTITFYDNNSAICVISTEANATCPASAGANFAAGTHIVTAEYSGDAEHSASTSNAANVTVLQDSTTTTITSTTKSATYGQTITFTATAQGAHGTPSGLVRFLDGANVLGTGTLTSDGTATLSISTLSTGTHAITAAYEANANSASSTSAVLTEVIQPVRATTTTTLTSSANPASSGQTITFTASVVKTQLSTQPIGAVTFLDGNIILGTTPLDSTGSASFSTSTLNAGTHNISASYAGDATAKGSISAATVEVVSPLQAAPPASFAISAAPVTVHVGQMASVMVQVSPANGFNQQVQLSCTNLPSESTCTFGSPMIRVGGGSTSLLLSTMAPHDCGSSTSYYSSMPYSAPVAAALLVLLLPGRKRRTIKGLLTVLAAFCSMTAISGCGNCTDLGTRPGTYTINVTGATQGAVRMRITVSQKLTLNVIP